MPAMTGDTLRQVVVITNPQGLHMRPIVEFVEVAGRFQSEVALRKAGEPPANGKSAFALLGLGAEQGTELTLEVTGPDAEKAMAALVEVLRRSSTEESS